MKKAIKLVLTVITIFCLALLITACPEEPSFFIALGDSVASGYGLALPEESHTAVFFNLLKMDGYVDTYVNMAVDGATTTTLLELLNNMDIESLLIFRSARIITINIGGNNLLSPFTNYMANSRIASGVDNIRLGAGGIISGTLDIISGIRTGVENLISDLEENRPPAPIVITGIGDVIASAGSIITGTGEILSGAPDAFSTLAGSFSPELKDELEKGLQTFSDDFEEIITLLKRKAPEATIIVNTVFNPFPQEVFRASLGFSTAANVLIEAMNNVIVQESKSRGYLVTDISAYFSNQLSLMHFNLNPSAGSLSFDIIHPNAEGHDLIARLNYETFQQR